MKYLLIIHANPTLADTLSEDEINEPRRRSRHVPGADPRHR
jgi:hypothetical protein